MRRRGTAGVTAMLVLAAALVDCGPERAGSGGGDAARPPAPPSAVEIPKHSAARPRCPACVAPALTAAGAADQPGSDWHIPHGAEGGIEGFADRTSVPAGRPVRLFVSTAAPRFRVVAFRMGWYRGAEGRRTWTSGPVPARRQPPPVFDPAATNTAAARWAPSVTVPTRGWAAGDYLLRLEASTGHESYVPLTVRAPSAAGRVVLINAVTTWQAYNRWGCCDLYQGPDGSFAGRARAVSFDRPYAEEQGAGRFPLDELGVVAEAERLHLPLAYLTDVDLEQDPGLLRGARAAVSMGHDEYWSPRMRAALTAARDAGTNLAFLGANAVYRRIRFAGTRLGADRLEINYKIATEDPMYGRDDAAVTADWPTPPRADPESRLLGDQYGCYLQGKQNATGVVADPRHWLFRGTHVRAGEHLPGLIGPETDAVQSGYPTPRPITVLLHSRTDCPGGGPTAADTSYYVADSGAGVFDAGTMTWACAVGPHCSRPISGRTHAVVQRVTDNLLTTFATGPVGLDPRRPR